MASLPNLLEYLSQPVPEMPGHRSTRITEADSDEYDAPGFAGDLGSPASEPTWAVTMETRDDADTYDDDVNLGGLAIPQASAVTERSAFTSDTYDNDVFADGVAIPHSAFVHSSVTKVEAETYDDDSSLEPLSFPSS